jgi:hypothetical protein
VERDGARPSFRSFAQIAMPVLINDTEAGSFTLCGNPEYFSNTIAHTSPSLE